MVPLAFIGLMLNANVSILANSKVNIIAETVLLNKSLPPNLNGCNLKIMIVERCSIRCDFLFFPFLIFLSAACIQRNSPFCRQIHRDCVFVQGSLLLNAQVLATRSSRLAFHPIIVDIHAQTKERKEGFSPEIDAKSQ